MRLDKIAIYIVVAAFLSFLVSLVMPAKPQPIINGYVDKTKIDGRKLYEKTLINSYNPQTSWTLGQQIGTYNQPEIAGHAALLVDIKNGNVLFEKNSSDRKKIASLVKIMTAVLALEHKKSDEKLYVSSRAAQIGENSMGINEGEIYTLEELLYGLMLHSGNDAAYAIAEGVAGNVTTFVAWMNIKAKELGLKDTYFADSSGLDDSSYSTAADLVLLTMYGLKNPEFRRVVATVEKELYGQNHKYLYLYNQTNLLTTYPGVVGVKTGYTQKAGLTLVTYVINNSVELVGTVLGSVDRKGDMILMLDHGFAALGISIDHPGLVF